MTISIFLSLGSNLGDRLQNLSDAVELLQQQNGMKFQHLSHVYETEPIGYVAQPAFLNMVVGGETSLRPEEVLATTQGIEQQLGRARSFRWGPRTIDIDILTYGQQQIQFDQLVIPHPRMAERAFVLVPFAEIAGDLPILTTNRGTMTPLQLLDRVADKHGVRLCTDIVLATEFGPSEN
jgi:2-amino-4-hydroxy-6-hydroxymethyldihydropteridine diphosphokinase